MRIDYNKIAPDAVAAMLSLEKYVNKCSLEKSLIELIRLRASQINGCTYCVDVHRKSALKLGESENRLSAVSNWKESSLFTDQERAVLDWTEAVTLLSESHVPDDIYNEVCNYFSDEKVVELTMIIITINSWNRLAVSFRK